MMPRQPSRFYSQRLAGQLRGTMTVEETRLWLDLRKNQLGVRFRRQVSIGPYIVDFACLPLHFIVEVDGSQHRGEYDRQRDAWLRHRGFTVMRFLE